MFSPLRERVGRSIDRRHARGRHAALSVSRVTSTLSTWGNLCTGIVQVYCRLKQSRVAGHKFT